MIPQQATLTTRKKFAKPNKELSENKKQNLQFVQNPPFLFPQSVLSQQFRNTNFNHGYTPQLNIPFTKGNVPPTQTNTLIHTPRTPKITNACMGCRETGHWKKWCPKANQSNKNDN